MSSNVWGDVPTWITAVATAALFVGAFFAALYAKRTYDRLGQQLSQDETEFNKQLDQNKTQFQEQLDQNKTQFQEQLDQNRTQFQEQLDQNRTQFQEQLKQDKSQFQLQQAKPSLVRLLVLTRRLRSHMEGLLDPRLRFIQWGRITLLSEEDALLKGAELLTAGYPQFEENLGNLAHAVVIFNDNKRPWRNSFLKERGESLPIDEDGINPWSEIAQTESGQREFDSVDFEVRQLLGIIIAKCNELETALVKAFEDLRS